jgi:c-di-GMP-binding flagellar brake protein YcgR
MRLVAYVKFSKEGEARKSRAYDIHAGGIYMRQTAGLSIPLACLERMSTSQNRNCMLSATLYVWPITVKSTINGLVYAY